jgi:hypothetical protein
MRNRSAPGQVARASFEFERIAVTQRVMVATVHQHGQATLAVPEQSGVSQTKDAERRDKVSASTGEDTRSPARPVKTSRNAGDGKNATAGL